MTIGVSEMDGSADENQKRNDKNIRLSQTLV